jgi:hypothetical protein
VPNQPAAEPPAVADLSHAELISWTAQVIRHLLVGAAPGE